MFSNKVLHKINQTKQESKSWQCLVQVSHTDFHLIGLYFGRQTDDQTWKHK